MTPEQRNTIQEYVRSEGVTFGPLYEEMVDHLSCDIENKMVSGLSFEQAFSEATGEIPANHLNQIQEETMEAINKRFTVSQWLSIGALFCLFVSFAFKILHLQGADEVLLLTFILIGGSLAVATLAGVKINRDKSGPYRLLGITVSVLILLLAYAFFLLHLSGGQELATIGSVLLAFTSVTMTIYAAHSNSSRNELLLYLHEKHTPGIERFLLIILAPLTLYYIFLIQYQLSNHIAKVFLLIVMFASSMQLIALLWRYLTQLPIAQRKFIVIALSVVVICFSALFLGTLVPYTIRVALIVIVTTLASWLAWHLEKKPRSFTSGAVGILVPIIFLGWAFLRLGNLPAEAGIYFFNLPVLFLLVAGLIMTGKSGPMRAFMIMAISSYLFEFIR